MNSGSPSWSRSAAGFLSWQEVHWKSPGVSGVNQSLITQQEWKPAALCREDQDWKPYWKFLGGLMSSALSHPPPSPGNPSMCSFPREPSGTLLRLHPGESWTVTVRDRNYKKKLHNNLNVKCFLGSEELQCGPPCVCGSVCGPWTRSAASSAWGQSSPRTPLDSAGRSLGTTTLQHTQSHTCRDIKSKS